MTFICSSCGAGDVVVLLHPPAPEGPDDRPAALAEFVGLGTVPQAAVPESHVARFGGQWLRIGQCLLIGVAVEQMRAGDNDRAAVLLSLVFKNDGRLNRPREAAARGDERVNVQRHGFRATASAEQAPQDVIRRSRGI